MPSTPKYTQDYDRVFVAAPGETISSEGAYLPITAEQKQRIFNGTEKLFTFGFIEYADGTGQMHRSGFAYVFMPSLDVATSFFSPANATSYWTYN